MPFCLKVLILMGLPLLGMAWIPQGSAAPIISEFMAANKSGLADEDGAFSDWIELYNPDPSPLNLAGYSLTDDPQMPAKWLFPSVSLPGGAHLVVFASG